MFKTHCAEIARFMSNEAEMYYPGTHCLDCEPDVCVACTYGFEHECYESEILLTAEMEVR